MAAGLRMDVDQGTIRLRLPNNVPLKDPAVLHPFMILLVIQWRTIMTVQIVSECINSPEGRLRVVNVEEHFERLSKYELTGEALAEWHAENPTVPALAAGVALHVVALHAGTYYWLRQTLCVSSNTSRLFWYNDVVHLIYNLKKNAGAPCAIEIASRCKWGEMLSGTTIFSPFDVDSCSLYPILQDTATGNFYLRRYNFDSVVHDKLEEKCANLEMRHKAAVDKGANLMAAMETARSEATKQDLRWDHRYTAAHEAFTMHAPVVAVRATELENGRVQLAASDIERTHCDLVLTCNVILPAYDACICVYVCSVLTRCSYSWCALSWPSRVLTSCPARWRLRSSGDINARACSSAAAGIFARNSTALVCLRFLPAGGADSLIFFRYFAEFMTPEGKFGDLCWDFIQVTESMLREGQRVFVTLDIELYADLRAMLPNLAVADRDLHKSLDTDPSARCQLEAYYILGDVTDVAQENFASDACLRVAFETDNGRSMVINVALHRLVNNGTYEHIVTLERSAASGPLVRELLTRRHARPARRNHGSRLCWV